jgi:hypothetical protein
VDRSALRDRLYAEYLAAPFRDPVRFCVASAITSEPRMDSYVRARAEAIRSDLSGTAADVEWAIKEIEKNESEATQSLRRIISLLSLQARNLLRATGQEMVLRVDRFEPGREILRWRFVSLALPPGILVAAATESGSRTPEGVRLLDSSIAPDHPVAQNHVHHAAMMSFEELWSALRLRALLRPGDLAVSLRDPRARCPGLHSDACLGWKPETKAPRAKDFIDSAKHMAEWGDVIRQAFIARRVLDRHSSHVGGLEGCRSGDCTAVVRTALRSFLAGHTKSFRRTGTQYPWPEELIQLVRRSREVEAKENPRTSSSRTELIRQQTAEERGFLSRAFARLLPDQSESADPVYETLFVQYLRVKTALFRLLVHPPGEGGLKNFFPHFQQIKVYAPEADVLRPRVPSEPGLTVKGTEYRVAPDAWFKILRRKDSEIEEGAMSAGPRSEAAWLIHFKREVPEKGQPLHGSAIRRMESEADQIARTLAAKPAYLRMLRGIDICGVEEAQPLWVSAEILRRLRRQSQNIACGNPRLFLKPLRLTLHAGEDFSWLTSGIRAIAEPFQWHLIERGDRIGHGIAITFDPVKWWERKEGKDINVKRFDRLLDLGFLAEYAEGRTLWQNAWLRSEIRQLTNAIWPQRKCDNVRRDPVEAARSLWLTLGRPLARTLMQTARWPEQRDRPHENWIHSYFWNPSTQDRANESIPLNVHDRAWSWFGGARNERDLLVKARARLISEIARWQVCIESNPSSNLVVGGLDAIGAAQDFLQQRPTLDAGKTLTWTISTDDPITFSTTLADEYAYAWAGMVLRQGTPYDPAYARALLDEAAATSVRMRFTIPYCPSARNNADG